MTKATAASTKPNAGNATSSSSSSSSTASHTATAAPAPASGGGSGSGWFFDLLSLVVLGLVAYGCYYVYQQLQAANALIAGLKSQIANTPAPLNGELDSLVNTMNALYAQEQTDLSTIDNQVQQVQDQVAGLGAAPGTCPTCPPSNNINGNFTVTGTMFVNGIHLSGTNSIFNGIITGVDVIGPYMPSDPNGQHIYRRVTFTSPLPTSSYSCFMTPSQPNNAQYTDSFCTKVFNTTTTGFDYLFWRVDQPVGWGDSSQCSWIVIW